MTAFAFVGASPASAAATINVPTDQPTIQAGIDAAVDGDTVVVAPGTYHEHINFNGKNIAVQSSAGAGSTTLDGDATGVTVTIDSPTEATFQGFTVRNSASAISLMSSPARVTANVIESGKQALAARGGSPTIDHNTIRDDVDCVMAFLYGTNGAVFADNVFLGNRRTPPSPRQPACIGGALDVEDYNSTSSTIERNVLQDSALVSESGYSAAIGAAGSTGSVIRDNVMTTSGGVLLENSPGSTAVQNVSDGRLEIIASYLDSASVVHYVASSAFDNTFAGTSRTFDATDQVALYNNIFAGGLDCERTVPELVNNNLGPNAVSGSCNASTGTANIGADPMFVSPGLHDYRLKTGSPSIDAGTTSTPTPLPANDIDGAGRVNGASVDQGAYEFTGTQAAENGGEFTPITPDRFLDTRSGNGLPGNAPARVGAGESVALQITGRGDVPASDVSAVVLNVTATSTNTPGPDWVTAYPDDGSAAPVAANLNFAPGETRPNLVTVKVAANGRIRLRNALGDIDLIADVMGFYSSRLGPAGSRFHGATPLRRIDTRTGNGGHAIGANEALTLDVRGAGDVPATGVTAIVMNVTITNPITNSGWLTVYPADVPRPPTASLNFTLGETVPNLVVVRVPTSGPDAGKIKLENGPNGLTDVVVDVVGWYDEDRMTDAGRLVAITPTRLFDTRDNAYYSSHPTLQPDESYEYPVGAWASSVVMNTAITNPTEVGWLTVHPFDSSVSPPLAANLNWTPGISVSNLVMIGVGTAADGYKISFRNGPHGNVDVIADLDGYFTAAVYSAPPSWVGQ